VKTTEPCSIGKVTIQDGYAWECVRADTWTALPGARQHEPIGAPWFVDVALGLGLVLAVITVFVLAALARLESKERTR